MILESKTLIEMKSKRNLMYKSRFLNYNKYLSEIYTSILFTFGKQKGDRFK